MVNCTLYIVETIFEANEWIEITAADHPVMMLFKKRRVKNRCFVRKLTFLNFSKNCQFCVFSHIQEQLNLKIAWLSQFSLWISIALSIIYLSHKVIIWEKILPISGHRGESVTVTVSQFQYNQAHQALIPVIKVEIKIGFFIDYN